MRYSTSWSKALNSTGNFGDGVVVAVSGDSFVVVSGGFIENVSHGFTEGSTMWLSTATNGLMSTTPPAGDAVKQKLGRALDSSRLLIRLDLFGST